MRNKLIVPIVVLVLLSMAATSWLALSESGLRTLTRWWLPESVQIDMLSGRAIGPVRLQGLHVSLTGTSIRADNVEFDWSSNGVLSGEISIYPLKIAGLKIQTTEKTPPSAGSTFVLPVSIKIPEASVDDIVLSTAQETWQVNSATFALAVDAQQVDIQHLELQSDTSWAAGAGQLPFAVSHPVQFELDWQLSHPDWPASAGRTQFSGSYENLEIIHEGNAPFALHAAGTARPLETPIIWQVDVDIPEFTPARMNQQWPEETMATEFKLHGAGQQIAAKGVIQIPQRLEPSLLFDGNFVLNEDSVIVEQLNLDLADTPAEVHMSGEIMLTPALAVSISGDWQSLQWPPAGTPQITSQMGRFEISGAPSAYTGWLSGRLAGSGELDKIKADNVDMKFDGSTEHIEMPALQVRSGDGRLSGTGRADWKEDLKMRAELRAEQLDPAVFAPELTGRVGFDLAVDATWPSQTASVMQSQKPFPLPLHPARYRLTLEKLHGIVNNQPVSGEAKLRSVAPGDVTTELDIRMGENTLAVVGVLGTELDLGWTLAAQDLAGLWPEASGQLASQGRLTGSPNAPRIDFSAAGTAVGWQDIEVARLQTDIDFALASGKIIDARVQAQDVTWREFNLATVAVTVDGLVADHAIDLAMEAGDGSVKLRAEGGYDHNDKNWRGQLLSVDSQSQQLGLWRLEAPTAVNVGWQQVAVGSTCLVDPPARLCVNKVSLDKRSWAFDGQLRQVDLPRLANWLPADYEYKGQLSAEFALKLLPDKPWIGAGKLQLEDAELIPSYEPEVGVKIRSCQVDLRGDEKRLTLNGLLDMGPPGAFTAQIHAGRTGPGAPVKGGVQGQFSDLGALTLLVPELANTSGKIVADLGIGGTVKTPTYAGRIALVDGSAAVTTLGITVQDVALDLEGHTTELQVRGSARSGEGIVNLDGTLDWSGKQLLGDLTLVGTRFRIMNREKGTQVDASPELALKFTGRELELTGGVHIDKAHIGGVEVSPVRITASPDEVIIGEKPKEPKRWRVTSRISVTLGDITIDAYGLKGKARGALQIVDLPGQPAFGTGELAIDEGFYKAFGVALDIEYGRLSFSGGAIGNPSIDARAVRHLESVTAGVDVRGPLMNPQLTVFSIPPRPHQQALALLMFGEAPVELGRPSDTLGYGSTADLERSMGLGGESAATPLRTYLSPDFYVGYLETLSLRYRISRKWAVEAQRGIESSLGITYSLQ